METIPSLCMLRNATQGSVPMDNSVDQVNGVRRNDGEAKQ